MQNRTLALGLIALSLIPFSAAFMFQTYKRHDTEALFSSWFKSFTAYSA
jgi:hypothetical protein